MPGARAGTSRLPYEDKTAPGWPTLGASDAINFTDASPVSLAAGTTLYRVYGGTAPLNGAYWSPEPPGADDTEARWRGATAVELSWNDAVKVSKATIQGSPVLAWTGGIALQPAQDTRCDYLPGYLLPGGDQQYWVGRGGIPGAVGIAETPWSSTTHRCPPPPPRPGPSGQGAAHAAHGLKLTNVSRLVSSAASRNPDMAHLPHVAGQLERMSAAFHAHTSQLDHPGHVVRSALAVQAHMGLRRHIELDPSMDGYEEIDRALEDLVASAVALAP
jgi:hypothetical protein